MLLTRKDEELLAKYYKGTLTETERQEVLKWDQQCVEIYGYHILKMPLTPEQEGLLERCRQCNLTTEEKKQVLQLSKDYSNYCGRWLLSGAMKEYCLSED